MSASLHVTSSQPGLRAKSRIQPTNSLILLLPELLFASDLLPLFHQHFESYGNLIRWTPLHRLGRVLVVYEDESAATAARMEMDGFIWQDEQEAQNSMQAEDNRAVSTREPIRVFFGPQLALPLPSLRSTLLSVPALSRNFLISPPGSPPVGWEQTLEEAPNANPHAEDLQPKTVDDSSWANELARALRFLSVSSGEDEIESRNSVEQPVEESFTQSVNGREQSSMTQLIVPPTSLTAQNGRVPLIRPAVTVSTPATDSNSENSSFSAPGAPKITAVKATIESMLGRKRSMSDLRAPLSPVQSNLSGQTSPYETDSFALGSHQNSFVPTARPPLPL